MRRLLLALALSLFVTTAVRAETDADRWNLAELYPSLDAWNDDAIKLDRQIKAYSRCQGHLGDSAARLRACLDERSDMTRRLYRLTTYSSQQLAQDTGLSENQALDQKTDLLSNRLSQATAFVEPEVLRVGARRIASFEARDKGLRVHRFPLRRILRAAPHTLDKAGEALVAQFGDINGVGGTAYSVLTNADLPWPKLTLSTGEVVTLDASAYTKYREAPDRGDREHVMSSFFGALKVYERTIGTLLYSQLRQDAVYAKVRRYPDSITRALDANRVPVAVIDTLIRETDASLPTLHRYMRLRARLLGVTEMAYHDIYPPIVQGDYKFPLARGRQLALEAVAPLGPDYVKAFAAGLDGRWMDAYPRPRKQSGAHMIGIAYDLHPYVLMNYNDDYESLTTLAHEWGHAMHTVLTKSAQPFETADYATFVAEIASTFNEELLLERMLKAAASDDERLYYLGYALEGLRATFYRQAMFADFERKIHALVDAGQPLTGEQLSKTYCEVLRRHHGSAESVVRIDDALCVEWSYIPHFYTPFYVYQYATSIAASSLFAQRVLAKEPGALERYLGLLRAGGSDDPYELVKAAGVDLATPAPYRALVARMNRIMDEIESILARRR